MIDKAIEFATKAREGQFRKGNEEAIHCAPGRSWGYWWRNDDD